MLSSTYSGILPIMLGSPFSYQLTECTDHINKHTVKMAFKKDSHE